MLQSLLSAIAEMFISLVGDAMIKLLGLENVVEFVTAVVGLACIVAGFVIWCTGS
jgi:hypothetical protein